MTKDRQKMKKANISYKNLKKNRWKIFRTEVSGSVLKKFMDPDLVNIRPDPQPWSHVHTKGCSNMLSPVVPKNLVEN